MGEALVSAITVIIERRIDETGHLSITEGPDPVDCANTAASLPLKGACRTCVILAVLTTFLVLGTRTGSLSEVCRVRIAEAGTAGRNTVTDVELLAFTSLAHVLMKHQLSPTLPPPRQPFSTVFSHDS